MSAEEEITTIGQTHQNEDEEIRESWNQKAKLWKEHVGNEGDWNRRLNSDPYLWDFLGDIEGLRMIDAGCGTGYLSQKLIDSGASFVVAIDLSPHMIDIATFDWVEKYQPQLSTKKIDDQEKTIDDHEQKEDQNQKVDQEKTIVDSDEMKKLIFRVDDCQKMTTFGEEDNGSFDLIVSNYVLMDLPDVDQALQQFHRLLKVGGRVIFVILHPCFPGPDLPSPLPGRQCQLLPFPSYFTPHRQDWPPWGHFQDTFIGYHRPLSYYWHLCSRLGFRIIGFDEPHLTPDRYHLLPSGLQGEKLLTRASQRPFSVIFHLLKE